MGNAKVWFITGSSTGFGRVLAEEVLSQGGYVVATARNPEAMKDLVGAQCIAPRLDVTDPESIASAHRAALSTFGRVDVLVNNAGYGMIGAIEELSDEEVRDQFDVNVFGVLNVMREVLPTLREQRAGHVLHVSSVGGFRSNPAFGIYAASKFALEAIGEASAQELAPLGIRTTIVEPGPFRTDWAGRSMRRAERRIEDYRTTAGKNDQWLREIDGNQPNDPLLGVRAMIAVTEMEEPPLRLPLGPEAFAGIRMKLETVAQNLEKVEALGMDMAYRN